MKKEIFIEGKIEDVKFPNKAILEYEGKKVVVKDGLIGQTVKVRAITKRGRLQGKIVEVLEKSPYEKKSLCMHFDTCGGCTYQNLRYREQLKLKQDQVKSILDEVIDYKYKFCSIEPSPTEYGYRNKMEFSFGDEVKGGELTLGLHKSASMYDVITTSNCQIVDKDYRKILSVVLHFFKRLGVDYYNRKTHIGCLRHLIIRKASKTNEIMVNIVTSSQTNVDFNIFSNKLLNIKLDGIIVSVIHTTNDSLSDAVKPEKIEVLYGRDYIIEDILGLKFKISPFSFFQTNSLAAERLYSIIKGFVGFTNNKVIFDLYSGTGTISQIIATVAKKVYGIELIEEAVVSARENAKINGLKNCEFIAGDLLDKIEDLKDEPNIIVIDPPRAGIHPKALEKIINFDAEHIIYVSCNPITLAKDLKIFQENGYDVEKVQCVDMFPHTPHIETVVKLSAN
ncbi:MAG TPA: 23S rRNA (uracil(1939)-C(5))-methyltransferase RlmD [Clostridiales bacterium]|nr:23S rRNA (uracil(1939)-C(5))-methyltransferase RlmD [Clostridiales bacterium]